MSEKISQIQIPIDWNVPDDLIARYATNMVVQKLENEFIISFFDIKQPIIIGEPAIIEEKLKELKSIRANCVAQIIVSADKMPKFVDALTYNLKLSSGNAEDEVKE